MDTQKGVKRVHSIWRHVLVQIFSLYSHTDVHESIPFASYDSDDK
jgi:hypothetical protein